MVVCLRKTTLPVIRRTVVSEHTARTTRTTRTMQEQWELMAGTMREQWRNNGVSGGTMGSVSIVPSNIILTTACPSYDIESPRRYVDY